MKDFLKSFAFKVLGVIALILVGVMIYGASTGGLATIPATIAGAIITPLQSAVTSVSDGISGFFGQFGSSKETREELEQAQKELRELREQVVDYDKMKEENEWYAKILGLHEQHSDYTFASGKVIAVDPLSPFGNFTINAGTKSGIAVGDPVITAEGLVGLVSEVSFTSCKVRTILDVNTKASAMISRNGNTAITGDKLTEMPQLDGGKGSLTAEHAGEIVRRRHRGHRGDLWAGRRFPRGAAHRENHRGEPGVGRLVPVCDHRAVCRCPLPEKRHGHHLLRRTGRGELNHGQSTQAE